MSIHDFFKKIKKPLKYGNKSSKNLVGAPELITHKKPTEMEGFTSQLLGILFSPIFFLIIEPLTRRFNPASRERIPLIFYTGFSFGSVIGSFLSATMLRELPAGFNNSISALISFVVVTPIILGISSVFSKIKRALYPDLIISEQEDVLSPDYKNRFHLGFESGFALGSAIGAVLECALPSSGLIAPAVGSIVGAFVGIAVCTLAPGLLEKLKPKLATESKEEDADYYSYLTKSIKLGTLIGSSIGIVLGTFLLPGIGSVLGGLLFGGIGAIVAGSAAYVAKKVSPSGEFIEKFLNKTGFSKMSFSAKVSVSTLSLVGAIVGTFLLPGLGTMAGAAIGVLAGGVIGAGVSACLDKFNLVKSDKDSISSFKQVKLGFAVGSTVGVVLGSILGSCVPVIGTILGGLLGGFVGGMIGVATPALKKMIQKPAITSSPNQEAPALQAEPMRSMERDSYELTSVIDFAPKETPSPISDSLEEGLSEKYSQQLDFRLGVEKRAPGVYTLVQEDASDEDNNAENSSAKSIDQEKSKRESPSLTKRLEVDPLFAESKIEAPPVIELGSQSLLKEVDQEQRPLQEYKEEACGKPNVSTNITTSLTVKEAEPSIKGLSKKSKFFSMAVKEKWASSPLPMEEGMMNLEYLGSKG
jgi:hypothetical protein